MEIKFIRRHVIRGETRADDYTYEKHQIVDFRSRVEETYARAYIERGYAIEYNDDAKAADADRARKEFSDFLSQLFAKGCRCAGREGG